MIEKRMKVPNGKLLIMKFAEDFSEVKIQGDFFLHPEEKLALIEDAIPGTAHDKLPEKLKKIIHDNKIEMVGVDVESICKLVREVLE